MKRPRGPTEAEKLEAMRERLRQLIPKARRNPKSLTLAEIDELCRIVVALAPPLRTRTDPE